MVSQLCQNRGFYFDPLALSSCRLMKEDGLPLPLRAVKKIIVCYFDSTLLVTKDTIESTSCSSEEEKYISKVYLWMESNRQYEPVKLLATFNQNFGLAPGSNYIVTTNTCLHSRWPLTTRTNFTDQSATALLALIHAALPSC